MCETELDLTRIETHAACKQIETIDGIVNKTVGMAVKNRRNLIDHSFFSRKEKSEINVATGKNNS